MKAIQTIIYRSSLLLIMLLLNACQSTGELLSDKTPLQTWIETELLPYLMHELATRPKYQNKRIQIVKMQGDKVLPEIDELSRTIRDRIEAGIIKNTQVNLLHQTSLQNNTHHRNSMPLKCHEPDELFTIGIDSHPGLNKEQIQINIRAIDSEDNKQWVTGMGLTYNGPLAKNEWTAMQTSHPDEHLQGLRSLPFASDEIDLAARYLAHNLSCLARYNMVKLANETNTSDSESPLQNFSQLLNSYLIQYHEVKWVNQADDVNAILVKKTIDVNRKGLKLLTASIQFKEPQHQSKALETQTYLQLSERTNVKTQKMIENTINDHLPLIESFSLISPIDPQLCNSQNPWQYGQKHIENGAIIDKNGCIAINVKMTEPAKLFLLAQNNKGGWKLIYPSQCLPETTWKKNRMFPGARHSVKTIQYDEKGAETLYAIAIKDSQLVQEFELKTSQLPTVCGNRSQYGLNYIKVLKQIDRKLPESVYWELKVVYH